MEIFRVGTMEIRYASRQHIKSWTLETILKAKRPHEAQKSDKNTTVEPYFLFQARPWRNPEGDLNARFLHQLLHAVITTLVRKPGIPLDELTSMLNPDLLPVNVIELVQILVELKCVRVKLLKKTRKATLFASSPRLPIQETEWLRDGRRYLDLDVSASLRFAYFVEALQAHPAWAHSETTTTTTGQGEGGDDQGQGEGDDGQRVEDNTVQGEGDDQGQQVEIEGRVDVGGKGNGGDNNDDDDDVVIVGVEKGREEEKMDDDDDDDDKEVGGGENNVMVID